MLDNLIYVRPCLYVLTSYDIIDENEDLIELQRAKTSYKSTLLESPLFAAYIYIHITHLF